MYVMCSRVHLIIGRLHAKFKDLNQEMRKLSAFKSFQDGQTDIISNQKEFPKAHLILGRLHVKNQGP